MHSAPAVSYPVGRLHFRVALSLILLLGGAALMLWYLQVDHPRWRQALATSVWLACGGLAILGGGAPAKGVLRWDGQNWSWESDNAVLTGTVIVRADWLTGVLLEFRAVGHGVRWLLLERRPTGQWLDLRRALWAPGPAASSSPVPATDR